MHLFLGDVRLTRRLVAVDGFVVVTTMASAVHEQHHEWAEHDELRERYEPEETFHLRRAPFMDDELARIHPHAARERETPKPFRREADRCFAMRDQSVRVRPELAHEHFGAGVVLTPLEPQRRRDARLKIDPRRNVAPIDDDTHLLRSIGQAAGTPRWGAEARAPEHDGGERGEDDREDEPDHETIVAPGAYAVLGPG